MHGDLKVAVVTILVALVVFAAAGYGFGKLEEWKCERKWADSGIPANWGWVQGCRIDPKANGKWIPAENYRDQQ